VDNPAAKFRVSLVWLVKTAVTSRDGDRTNLVAQYNLKSKDIYGKRSWKQSWARRKPEIFFSPMSRPARFISGIFPQMTGENP